MRLAGTKLAANHQYRGFGDQLYDLSGQRPSLDLQFANQKSLVDATTGQNLVTFTRASSGTYVDSQGVIRTATTNEARFDHNPTTGESLGLLVEEQRTNLLLRSEEFNDVYWSKNFSSVTANSIAAPDGTTTADLLIEDNTTNVHEVVTPSISFALNATYALSVFVKAGTRSAFRIVRSGPGGASATFDLLTLTAVGTAGSPTVSITAFNSNWYRCTMSWTASVSAARTHAIRLDNPAGTDNYTGNGVGGIYVWGAQLETGAFPTSYIPTTAATVTRSADVASITGSNFGVSRTNLLLRSEEFDNASWTKGSSVSVSANTVIAPNGTLTADTVTADSGFGVFQTITSVIGVNYSNSIYVKAGTAASMMFRDDTGAGRHIIFNPLTGVITSTAGTLVSSGSQAVGDGWYRYWMVYVADATSVRGIIRPNSAGSAQTFAVWGAQLEAGSTATAYIPTTTAAVTVVESPWYRQDEGTVFGDFTRTANTNTQQGRVFSFSDGTNTNLLEIYQTGGSNPAAQIIVTTSQAGWTTSNFTVGTSTREVLGYQLNNTNASFNGSSETADTVCTMPTALTQARIGDRQDGVRTLNGTIRRLTYWPTRLPNETLQGITQ